MYSYSFSRLSVHVYSPSAAAAYYEMIMPKKETMKCFVDILRTVREGGRVLLGDATVT